MEIRKQVHSIFLAGFLLLTGCGNKPMQRAQSIVFDRPYMVNKTEYETVTLGMKVLSELDVKELFCKSDELIKQYHILYLRAENVGTKTYTVSLVQQKLLAEKEVLPFLNPSTTASSALTTLIMIPLGLGVASVTTNALAYFAAMVGLPLGLHYLFDTVRGVAGYEAIGKHVITRDGVCSGDSLTILPCASQHYFIFADKRDPNSVIVSCDIAAKGESARRVKFNLVREEH
jgi:hypothetical protein